MMLGKTGVETECGESECLGGYLYVKGRKLDCVENCIMMNFILHFSPNIVRMIKSSRVR
jgi:hypothetical protein